jgi:hypothetical protein
MTAPDTSSEADARLNTHVQSVLTTQITVWYCHPIVREGGDFANARPPGEVAEWSKATVC